MAGSFRLLRMLTTVASLKHLMKNGLQLMSRLCDCIAAILGHDPLDLLSINPIWHKLHADQV